MTTSRLLSRRLAPRALLAFALVTSGALLSACSKEDSDAAAKSGIVVSDAWARTSPMAKGAGALYATLTNNGEANDELVAVSVPSEIAATAELHETVSASSETTMGATPSDGSMASETTAAGMGGMTSSEMMTMKPVSSIQVPANEVATLAPGGYHVMLMEMPTSLKAGETFEATLTFRDAGDVKVKVEVRDQ